MVKTHAYDLGITTKRAQDPLRMPDAMLTYTFVFLQVRRKRIRMVQALVSLWYVDPFFEWVGAKMTVVGLTGLCSRIPIESLL